MTPDELKRKLKEIGVSQKEFAEASGVHTNTVSQWVRGINEIPPWVEKFIELYAMKLNSDKLKSDIDKAIEALTKLKSDL